MKKILLWIFMVSLVGTVEAATIGDDGLHKAPWIRDTFKDNSCHDINYQKNYNTLVKLIKEA